MECHTRQNWTLKSEQQFLLASRKSLPHYVCWIFLLRPKFKHHQHLAAAETETAGQLILLRGNKVQECSLALANAGVFSAV